MSFEQMKEEVIRQGWRREPNDKEKALDAKQRQLEESFRSKELLKEKDEQIEQLQSRLMDAAVDLRERSLEIKHLTNYIEDVRTKNQKELETQIQYNLANEKSLRRLTEREVDVDKHLKEMTSLMEASLTKYGYRHKDARERAYAVNNIDKAKSTLYLLLKMIDEYDLIKTRCMHLLDERKHVLMLIGGSTGDMEKDVEEVNLVNVIKDFAISKEDNIFKLNKELTDVTDKFGAMEKALGRSEANKEMLTNLREDIMAKEEVINQLEVENEELKTQLSNAKASQKKISVKFPSPVPKKKSVSFPSPEPNQKKSVSFPSPEPNRKKSVKFPSPEPHQKKSVSFPSPAPQQKKSVSFPSPTPSHMSGQQIQRKRTPFKQVRIKTPIASLLQQSESESDYDDDSAPSELPPTPIPQLKLPTNSHPEHQIRSHAPSNSFNDTTEFQKQKMKVQFNLPTNHSTRLGEVLAQGMYFPPLMKQGMDFRVSGPSGPMAVAKTLNAAHTKMPKKPSPNKQASFGIGGTQIINGNHHQQQTSALFGGGPSHRGNGQAKVLRVSSLAPSNKQNRKSTNSTQFAYQTAYGNFQPGGNGVPTNGRALGRRSNLWK